MRIPPGARLIGLDVDVTVPVGARGKNAARYVRAISEGEARRVLAGTEYYPGGVECE